MYHSNITLIMIENNQPISDNIYFEKLNIIFDSLVLLYGLDDLINIKNVEKFKREIRVSINLLNFHFNLQRFPQIQSVCGLHMLKQPNCL
jgi:hypothetical protein